MPRSSKKPGRQPRSNEATSVAANTRRNFWLGAILIAALSLFCYWPSLSGEFILDDDILLTKNALIKAPDGLFQAWYTTKQPDYVPLTSTTLWLEWRLWGMNSTGYHVTNLALHIVGCLLIWLVLRKLRIPGAFLAALLYAIHPVNVESVAWIEQRKNTLSLVLFLFSIFWFFQNDNLGEDETTRSNTSPRRWYWLSLVAFALALLTKGAVAILPLVLLLLIWWRHGTISRRDLVRCAPFFVVAAVLTPIIIWFVNHGSGEVARHATFLQRLLGAGAVVWFYLYKALLPINLSFVYPLWQIDPADFRWWIPLLAATALTIALWFQRRSSWGRSLFVAWIYFCVALGPVLGFSDAGFMQYSLVADHYQYLALISVVAIVAAGWSYWYQRIDPQLRWLSVAAAGAIMATLVFLTTQQAALYRSRISLYEAALALNPESWMLHNNLGLALVDQGKLDEAIKHYQSSLAAKPDYYYALNNLGNTSNAQGRYTDAIDYYKRALEIKPSYAEAHNNLGLALLNYKDPQQAIEQFQEALKLDQSLDNAEYNWGLALGSLGQFEPAIAHYQQAIRLNPGNMEAYANMAAVYAQLQQPDRVLSAAHKAIELALAQGNHAATSRLEKWLADYQASQFQPNSSRP
jgi:tetratricopeptide (TPR) repeat protein